jgi:hypothetical protein
MSIDLFPPGLETTVNQRAMTATIIIKYTRLFFSHLFSLMNEPPAPQRCVEMDSP